MEILKEAGLPDGVIQFLPGDAELITDETFNHPEFAGLHFTGSTFIFNKLWKRIATNLSMYKSFPRVVGETGGKNMHFVHKSADVNNVVLQTVRSAFEYQGKKNIVGLCFKFDLIPLQSQLGQKCSACSRLYAPDNLWPQIKAGLVEKTKSIKVGPVDGRQS